MIFYDFHGAPSPRRARMFIAEKNIDIESREIDLKGREQFSPEFLAINPRGTVPALVTDKGLALTENVGIAAYLEEEFPTPPLMGSTADERGAVLMWNAICETQGFLVIGNYLRNSNPGHRGRAITGPVSFEQIPDLASRAKKRADIFFNMLEAQLTKSAYLATDKFSFADISGFIVCDFAQMVKISIPKNCSATQAWYDKIKARPSAKI